MSRIIGHNIPTSGSIHVIQYCIILPMSTVDIRGAFLNAEFTYADAPIFLRINADIVPSWLLQDPTAQPYITDKGESISLPDKFLYGLKQSPLKF